ncbi:hypothetical protein BCR44DRAFT_64144 [Catenaria anguillulae PL171]|uniref:Uncharacterized protein n=1 Tax=Catenaria anguillulae PL171 TaxID=765915 RepID=A0A1Y2HBG7_9FUNG|nr:hypothetical protein BCR44DRAFT_64144 [Catenaria anguillulae PL171]
MEDIKNKTLCTGPKEYEEAANKYVQRLKTHPFRSTSSGSCINGAEAERDLNKCGFYTEFAACQFKDGCPDIDSDLAKRCPKVLADFRAAYSIAEKEQEAANGSTSSNKGLIAGVVIGIVAFAIVIGLCMLKRTRVKSSNLKETLGRMTFGRTFGRQQSQSNVNSQPPPQIHFANSTSAAATPTMMQQPQHYQQQQDAAHLIPQEQPPAHKQPSPMASPHFSPRVSSSPAPATPMAGAPLAAGAAAAGIVYVDEYGRPVSPIMSPTSGPMVTPIATQPAYLGTGQQYQQQHANHQSAHDHSNSVLTPAASTAALVAPTASDAADAQQMLTTTTSTQVDTHTHTTHQSQVHHQVHEETYVTTTTAVEEFVVYIDENGNPCDEQGNPLPETMPEVMAMRAAQRGEAGVSMGTR